MISKICVITAIFSLLIISGCTKDQYIKPDLGKSKAEIILKPGEFRVIKNVYGEASTPFLFWLDITPFMKGIGQPTVPVFSFQLGDPNIHERAMRDLHSQHDLRGKPQVLHNFLVEWTLANYLGLFAILKLSISAEVIEFTEQEAL